MDQDMATNLIRTFREQSTRQTGEQRLWFAVIKHAIQTQVKKNWHPNPSAEEAHRFLQIEAWDFLTNPNLSGGPAAACGLDPEWLCRTIRRATGGKNGKV